MVLLTSFSSIKGIITHLFQLIYFLSFVITNKCAAYNRFLLRIRVRFYYNRQDVFTKVWIRNISKYILLSQPYDEQNLTQLFDTLHQLF